MHIVSHTKRLLMILLCTYYTTYRHTRLESGGWFERNALGREERGAEDNIDERKRERRHRCARIKVTLGYLSYYVISRRVYIRHAHACTYTYIRIFETNHSLSHVHVTLRVYDNISENIKANGIFFFLMT